MGNFKLKLNIDIAGLKDIIARKQELIQHNIEVVLKRDAIPYLIERIMVGYDGLSEIANMNPDDPTNPANWRTEFLTKLKQDMEQTFMVSGSKISVKLGDKDFLGYNPSGNIDPDDAEPLHWLVFYLEGLLGDWAFISPHTFEIVTRGRRDYNPTWGRFMQGFMVSKEDYEAQGWHRIIPFSEVRHPFSGFAPLDIFVEALEEFRLRPFVQKAFNAAMQGKKL